mgnify:CR=1 FL=1
MDEPESSSFIGAEEEAMHMEKSLLGMSRCF